MYIYICCIFVYIYIYYISFVTKELVIQQLQDEISQLCRRQSNKTSDADLERPSRLNGGVALDPVIGQLKEKLRLAAKYISQLAKEKQLLIDMGNRLRAELSLNGLRNTSDFYSICFSDC